MPAHQSKTICIGLQKSKMSPINTNPHMHTLPDTVNQVVKICITTKAYRKVAIMSQIHKTTYMCSCKKLSVPASWATQLQSTSLQEWTWGERKMGEKKLFQFGQNRNHFVWSGERTEKRGLIWNHNKLDLAGIGWNGRRSGWRRREEEGLRICEVEWQQSKRWDYTGKAIITLPHLAPSQERTCDFSTHLHLYTQTLA